MMSKIINNLNSLNNFSKKIIVYVSIISLLLCFGGLGIISYSFITEQSISLHTIGSNMIYHAIMLFTEFILVSLIIDFFNTLINLSDDN